MLLYRIADPGQGFSFNHLEHSAVTNPDDQPYEHMESRMEKGLRPGGFGILMFHTLPPLQQFGVMIALSITYSFVASTYILPTLLILWAKWRQRHGTVWVKEKTKKKKGGRTGKKKA